MGVLNEIINLAKLYPQTHVYLYAFQNMLSQK